MVDVKQAVSKAMDYLEDMYQIDQFKDVLLEEVDLSEDNKYWNVTIGFTRLQDSTSGGPMATLINICRRVQSEYSHPRLAGIEDIDKVQEKDEFTFSVRGVMGQLSWHWSYHSGQVGLLRLLWGSDYQWTSEDIVPLSPCHKG